MGEVYRAKDTRLGRDVAIKILPKEMSADAARKQRFEREAKTISGLNHPNICTLHDVGSQDGVDYLVMECVEGETLAKRLEKGPLPLEQVLKYGAQIADALDKAHRTGIVHRDLKPGNIMLTASGAKLLDFGLAKSAAVGDLATLTTTRMESTVTEQGTIAGTFHYMSPEQLEGQQLDGRSDIFSLGAVLYEMVTGQRAFEGKTRLSVASAILEKEPQPINALKPMMPVALDHSIRQCLAKDREQRWQTGRDLASELRWVGQSDSQVNIAPRPATQPKRQVIRLGLIGVVVSLTTLGIVFAVQRWGTKPTNFRSIRFALTAPDQSVYDPTLALSPDGNQLAFVVKSKAKSEIWLRPLDTVSAHPIPGTEGGTWPFWSPDGRYIGFFAGEKLKRVDIAKGSVQTLCDAFDPRGGTWNQNGVIVFSPRADTSLYRISAEGGTPEPASILDTQSEVSHRWPQFLPDGHHVLYNGYRPGGKSMTVWLGSLDTKSKKRIMESNSMVVYVEPGYLIYVREHSLVAQVFDLKHTELTGIPFILAEDVDVEGEAGLTGRASFSAAGNGALAFLQGVTPQSQLAWYDRKGNVLETLGAPADYEEPVISPDGKLLAFTQGTRNSRNIWIRDLTGGTQSRFSFDSSTSLTPVWTPDGKRIVFASDTTGNLDLYWKASDGNGEKEPLLSSATDKSADEVSPDGRYLLYEDHSRSAAWSELWVLPLSGERKPKLYLQAEAAHLTHAAFSPDGRWVAYTSNETGIAEVFVQSFPNSGSKFQISNGGGDAPVWRSDGKELLYFGPNGSITSVRVETGATFRARTSTILFQVLSPNNSNGPRTYFALDRDGRRILVNRGAENPNQKGITLVTNWEAELKTK